MRPSTFLTPAGHSAHASAAVAAAAM